MDDEGSKPPGKPTEAEERFMRLNDVRKWTPFGSNKFLSFPVRDVTQRSPDTPWYLRREEQQKAGLGVVLALVALMAGFASMKGGVYSCNENPIRIIPWWQCRLGCFGF